MTIQALRDIPLSARPELRPAYETQRSEVLQAARPLAQLSARVPLHAAEVEAVRAAGKSADVYLPLAARSAAWTVLLDSRTADILAYLPLDSF